MVLQYPKAFWNNLYNMCSYGLMGNNCPAEAHFIERLLPLIFCNTKKVKTYMFSEEECNKMLEQCENEFNAYRLAHKKKTNLYSRFVNKIKNKIRK